MSGSTTILKEEKLKEALDYAYLKGVGLEHLQKLSGAAWTDYNIHDPGVTVLEQLCFALTDISYRINFDIKDILASSANPGNDGVDNTFFSAAEILHCAPVTILDYRKQLVDKVNGVRNAWIEPLNLTRSEDEIGGLYVVLLEVPDEYVGQEERILEDTREVLSSNRNLCEDMEDIFIMKYREISVAATIEVEQNANIDSVHAAVLAAIEDFLSHPIRFRSLHEVQSEGQKINDIFQGPRLQSGFVDEADLYPRAKVVYNSQLIKIIMEIPGVESVRKLSTEPSTPDLDGFVFHLNEIPKLSKEMIEGPDSARFITYFKQNVEFSIASEAVEQKLREIHLSNSREYSGTLGTTNDLPIPKGESMDLLSYQSIQNSFPRTYAIGKGQLPSSSSDRRKGQAFQLKAYLLFFEQVMANELAQLTHATNLFSLDKSIDRTYYFQTMTDVPDLGVLLEGMEAEGNEEKYRKKLERIVTRLDTFNERRHRFLNHLLARFGEQFTRFLQSRFNVYYSAQVYDLRLLNQKIDYLKNYPFISSNRGKGYDKLQEFWANGNMSGLEWRIKTVLGLNLSNSRLAEVVEDTGIYFRDPSQSDEDAARDAPYYPEISNTYINQDFRSIPPVVEEEGKGEEDDCKSLNVKIDEYLLTGGFDIRHFLVGPNPHDKGETFLLVYCCDKTRPWLKVSQYCSIEEAEDGARRLVQYIARLNIESEGLHVLEHTLLRPIRDNKMYGLHFYDQAANIDLKSTELFTWDKIQEGLDQLIESAKSGSLEIQKKSGGDYEILFQAPAAPGQVLKITRAKAGKNLGDLEEAEREKKRLINYFKKFSDLDTDSDRKVKLYMRYYDGLEIDAKQYSFRTSIILPSWPARFQSSGFRTLVENWCRQSAPAHVSIDFYWMGFHQMKSFEKKYDQWLGVLRADQENPDVRNKLSLELLMELLKNSVDEQSLNELKFKTNFFAINSFLNDKISKAINPNGGPKS